MPISLGRCPVPFPHITNQDSPYAQKEACPENAPQSVKNSNPHHRLFSVQTAAVAARKCGNLAAPKDSLDLSLSACYDHHHQFWAHPAATKIQYPTQAKAIHGRCWNWESGLDSLGDQHDVNHEPYRNYSTHINCHISGSHTCSSARGFGRGIDGLFYNS